METWNENKIIDILYSKGLSDTTKATFTFTLISSKTENLKNLGIVLENNGYYFEIKNSFKYKLMKGHFKEDRDLRYFKTNFNVMVGWIFSKCCEFNCELKTCGFNV
jgi:hypothetical protein